MAHNVICAVCGQKFDRDTVQATRYSSRRYAHQECYPEGELVPMPPPKEKKQKQKEKNEDLIKLEEYIKKLFNYEKIPQRVYLQINQYVKEYGYSYSGILKTLVYAFEVKHNDITKANGGIGIVPYLYDQAYRYYYALWEAQQRNVEVLKEELNININTKEVIIVNPHKEPMKKKKKYFSFLEESEEK